MKIEPGMLCLVKGYVACPENLGKIVTAVRTAHKGEFLPECSFYTETGGWVVEGEVVCLVTDCWSGEATKEIHKYGVIPEYYLMPLKPSASNRPSEEAAKDRELAIV